MLNATEERLRKENLGEAVPIRHGHALHHEFEVALNKVLGWGWSLQEYIDHVCQRSQYLYQKVKVKKMATL